MDSIIGILKKDWFNLLNKNRCQFHLSALPKVWIVTLYSFKNTKDKKREDVQFGKAINETSLDQPPVFILGHWRSGTTLLQNLMVQDANFVSPNIFECRNPHTFLVRQNIFEHRRAKAVAATRPTDNVKIRIDSPAEEEFAVGVMSLMTPLLGWVFPKNRDHYERYLTFSEVPESEINTWKTHYLYFLKKITYKHKKQLLLKSPVNTARVKLLLDLFPKAKFIHIHRHPYDVYRSTLKMYRTAVVRSSFQGKKQRNIEDDIIDHYKRMHQAYFADRALIPAGQLLEVSFSQLEQEPMIVLRNIYDYYAFPNLEKVEANFRNYLDQNQSYRKNIYEPLPERLKKRLQTEWAMAFENWGYKS
ncbi:sulfotransferase family protein [Calditrichota bacterium GD2]